MSHAPSHGPLLRSFLIALHPAESDEAEGSSSGGDDGRGDDSGGDGEQELDQKQPLFTKDDIQVFGVALLCSFCIRS